MVSPQKEQGYTPIANEIVDKFCQYRLSGEEWLVLWVILRKTYGWNKKEDRISLSQFCLMTGLKRSSVVRAIKKLVTKQLLSSNQKATSFGNMYRFNKDFDKWKVVTKQLPRGFAGNQIVQGSNQIVNKVVTKKLHTKDNTKDTIQKKGKIPPPLDTVIKYFEEIKHSAQANPFFDYFESNGWKVGGKTLMKDWRAAARNWCRRAKNFNTESKVENESDRIMKKFREGDK